MKKPDCLLWLCLGVLWVGLPFGVAVQTGVTGVACVFALLAWRGQLRQLRQVLSASERRSWTFMALTLCLCAFATLLNPRNPERDVVSFLIGFAPFFCLPLFFARDSLDSPTRIRRLEFYLALGSLIWALAAFTQLRLGWKLSGSLVEWGEHFRRAQGFYSHPLTLAYVALLLWVPSLGYSLQCRNNPRAWTITGSLGFLLYASASRTAQALALALGVLLMLLSLRGRTRFAILALLGACLVLVLNTQNMVSERFIAARSQAPVDRESPYADDRIAFWLAHLKAVEERPLLGHGVHLGRDYRKDYYAKIGLPDMKKTYEAHNQILQLAFEGGLLAALSFLIWLWYVHRSWENLSPWYQRLRDLTILGFLLGGLTQNAFFDSEVRYTLGLIMTLAFAVSRSSKPKTQVE